MTDWFDGEVAATYDDPSDEMFAPALLDATTAFLAGLAGRGRALELAIGTGRVALPLAARGVPVSGIELSPDMLERLRAKPGGDGIDVVEGDMTTTRVPGEFSLVYLVYNTITNLTTQDAQVAAFENAARHLAPGGRFVIEVYLPDPASAPSRRALPCLRRRADVPRLRRVRRRLVPAPVVTPPAAARRTGPTGASPCRSATCGRPSWT